MTTFELSEIGLIDQLWRSLPSDHVWMGWSTIGDAPDEVWLFRQNRNWRRFLLRKRLGKYVLADDADRELVVSDSLKRILDGIAQAPGKNSH